MLRQAAAGQRISGRCPPQIAIRVDNRKIWICLISFTSVWGIFQAVITLYPTMLGAEEFLALNISSRLVLSIAIDVLVLYQTYTLYKKRRHAIEISE